MEVAIPTNQGVQIKRCPHGKTGRRRLAKGELVSIGRSGPNVGQITTAYKRQRVAVVAGWVILLGRIYCQTAYEIREFTRV